MNTTLVEMTPLLKARFLIDAKLGWAVLTSMVKKWIKQNKNKERERRKNKNE